MVALKYLEDESVQSWVLRNLRVSGCLSLHSVIGTNGQWHNIPHLSKCVGIKLVDFDDFELLVWLRKSSIAVKRAGIFDNPLDYINSVYRVFTRQDLDKRTRGSIPIRFCSQCLQNFIQALGFAYFKFDWLYGERCTIHDVPLTQLRASRYEEVMHSLGLVMSGHLDSLEPFEQATGLLSEPVEESDFHIMPCLIFDFYRWASFIRDDGYLDDSHWEFYYQNLMRKPISDNKIHYYFSASYPKRFPKQFGEFLSERLEVKVHRFGISQPLSLKETLWKSNRHNCSKCLIAQDHCPIQLVAKVWLDSPWAWGRSSNICDDFLRYRI
ncbi:hypothetical protein RJD39_12150 [Vibrio scophthalmi]|uniref:hypothetical protein n=1 Tax=Vibrio scophthalmi TaxID=45658 RepID=UPI00387317DC